MVQHGVRAASGFHRPLAGKPDARSAKPALRSDCHVIVCPGRIGGASWRIPAALVRDRTLVLRPDSCGVSGSSFQSISSLLESQPGDCCWIWRNADPGDGLGKNSQPLQGIEQRSREPTESGLLVLGAVAP